MTTIVIALGLSGAAYLSGQELGEPGGARGPARHVVHPVLVPVDDEGQAAGEYVYVPRELYDELYRRLDSAADNSTGPLIESANYVVELADSASMTGALDIRTLTVELSLSQLADNTRIRLPLRRDRVRISDVRAGGQPIAFEWAPDGNSLAVVIERAESRTVQIVLRPAAARAGTGEFVLPIPPIPRSRVTLLANAALDHIDVPSALGRLDRSMFGKIEAELGPANELRVRLGAPVSRVQDLPDADASELLWLHVQPNAMQLRAQIRFTPADGQIVEVVEVEADPELRLVPPTASQPWLITELLRNGRRVIQCWLDEPALGEIQVGLSFTLPSKVGRVVLPEVRTRARRRAPPWLGISSLDEVSVRILPEGSAPPIAPSEFGAAWGRPAELPKLAVMLPTGTALHQVAITPLAARIAADQELDITLGNGIAAVAYESQLVVERGSYLELLVRVPADFRLREAILIHDDINRLLRWNRVDSTTLAIFSTVPLTGSFRMWLRGDLPLARSGSLAIPLVRMAEPGTHSYRVRLYRRSDSQIQIDATPGLIADKGAAAQPFHPSQGRFLAAFTSDKSASVEPSVNVTVAPNRPRLQGGMVTALYPREDAWWVDVALQLSTRNGVLDVVRLRLPPEVADSVELVPDLSSEVVRVPGERARQLVVRLSDPDQRELNLRVRARLLSPAPESVQAPHIELLDAPNLPQFLVLPKAVGQRPLVWNTSGLQAATLPRWWRGGSDEYADGDVYRIMRAQMQAVVGASDQLAGLARVALADYRYRWFADGGYEGWAGFDLEPAGVSSVVLVLPPACRLIHVTAGGRVVAPEPAGESRWRVPIAVQYLPQRLEVVLQGRLLKVDGSAPISFPAAKLADVPIDETLWTVTGPRQFGPGTPVLAHTQQSEVFQANLRLETARRLEQASAARLVQETTGEPSQWRSGWSEWIRQLEEELVKAAQRQAGDPSVARSWGARYDVAGLWTMPGESSGYVVRCAFHGEAPLLEVHYATTAWHEWLLPGLWIGLLLAAVLAVRRLQHADWLRRCWLLCPYFFLALAGVAWWLWLSPSVLGLVIVGLAGVLALRS